MGDRNNLESFCEACQKYTVVHNKSQGSLICGKCKRIKEFHHMSRENEVRFAEEDSENKKESRVKQTFSHPLYKTDDLINRDRGGDKFKQEQNKADKELEKNIRTVEEQIQKRLVRVSDKLTNDCLNQWYIQAKQQLDKIAKENNSEEREGKKKKNYTLDSMRVDAVIAMFKVLKPEARDEVVLLEKLGKKMLISDVSKVEKRAQEFYQMNLKQESQRKRPIDEAKEKAKIIGMGEAELGALEQLSLNIETEGLIGGEQSATIAGSMLYLICSNSSYEHLNNKNLKDISQLVDKAETTLKKYYEDRLLSNKSKILPTWSTRRY